MPKNLKLDTESERLEDTFLKKPQGGQFDPPSLFRVKEAANQSYMKKDSTKFYKYIKMDHYMNSQQ